MDKDDIVLVIDRKFDLPFVTGILNTENIVNDVSINSIPESLTRKVAVYHEHELTEIRLSDNRFYYVEPCLPEFFIGVAIGGSFFEALSTFSPTNISELTS